MQKTLFSVPKMDCPSEEKLIRMALSGHAAVKSLSFDLNKREITVGHEGDYPSILKLLEPLNFGARILSSHILDSFAESARCEAFEEASAPGEAKVLRILLAINALMFVFEITLGWLAQSTGLIADSLDMFADAAVYGISLYAAGRTLENQRKAARLSGYLQFLLAVLAVIEVMRRFYFGSEPLASYMIAVSFIALLANVSCLVLISKHRTGGVHMQASWIFSANDVIANLGVLLAGALVYVTKSPYPDLVIGGFIAAVVFRGALKILKISAPR